MGSSSSKQESKSEPWAPAQAGLKGLIPQIEGLPQKQFFPGQTYANFNPAQSESLGGIVGLANSQIAGGGLLPRAASYDADVLSGKYLTPDSGVWKGVTDPVLAATTARWSQAGRGSGNYGGSGVAADTAKGIMGAWAPYAAAERGNMEAASSRAAGQDRAAYDPFAAKFGAGEAMQGMDQKGIDEAMARFGFGQNAASMSIEEKLNFLTRIGAMGQQNSGTTTATPSTGQTIAGVGLTAAGLGGFKLPWM